MNFNQSIYLSIRTFIVRPLEEERRCITIDNKTLKTEYKLDAVKRLWEIGPKMFSVLKVE